MKGIKKQIELALSSRGLTDHRNELFEDIWKEYYPGLKIFCRTYLSGSSDLDDVCQEIMLKVFNKLHIYNPLFSFNTWLYAIARNSCIMGGESLFIFLDLNSFFMVSLGSITGFIAMAAYYSRDTNNPGSGDWAGGSALAILTIFYSLIFYMVIAVPFKNGLKNRLIDIE